MKFKIGDKVIVNAPLLTYESQFNGTRAIIISFFQGFVGLDQDAVYGEWHVPETWLKHDNSTKIKERLGIK